MRLGRGAVAFAAGARKIEKSAELASLAQFCVLSHHLVESAERVARFLEHRAIAGTEGENNRLSSLASTQTACLPPVTALVAASLVTLALHGVAPRTASVTQSRGERGVWADPSRGVRRVRARVFVVAVICHRRVLTPAGRDARRRARPETAGVLGLHRRSLSRLGRRERTRVRRKVSTGALDGSAGASDDEDDEDDEDGAGVDGDAFARARATDRRRRRARARGKRRAAARRRRSWRRARSWRRRFGRARRGSTSSGRTQSLTARLAPCCLSRSSRLPCLWPPGTESARRPARRRRAWRSRRFRVSTFGARARARTRGPADVACAGIGAAARDGGGRYAAGRARRVDETGVSTCARARRERRGRRGARSRLSSKPEKHGLSHSSSGRLRFGESRFQSTLMRCVRLLSAPQQDARGDDARGSARGRRPAAAGARVRRARGLRHVSRVLPGRAVAGVQVRARPVCASCRWHPRPRFVRARRPTPRARPDPPRPAPALPTRRHVDAVDRDEDATDPYRKVRLPAPSHAARFRNPRLLLAKRKEPPRNASRSLDSQRKPPRFPPARRASGTACARSWRTSSSPSPRSTSSAPCSRLAREATPPQTARGAPPPPPPPPPPTRPPREPTGLRRGAGRAGARAHGGGRRGPAVGARARTARNPETAPTSGARWTTRTSGARRRPATRRASGGAETLPSGHAGSGRAGLARGRDLPAWARRGDEIGVGDAGGGRRGGGGSGGAARARGATATPSQHAHAKPPGT